MLYGDKVWKIDDDDDDGDAREREREIIAWCPWLSKKGWPETGTQAVQGSNQIAEIRDL